MAIGQDFYPDSGLRDIENLSRLQSGQSLAYGDQAARYADPFMQERGKYQKKLSDLMANPGEFSSSPAYKFAYDQGLEALHRKGNVRSGAKLAELTKYGQGMAGQQYFNQAKLLSDLAMSGSSPASAGLSYARGAENSMDRAAISAAARAAGQGGGARGGGAGGSQTPWWMQNPGMPTSGSQSPGWTQTTYGPGGGSSGVPYYGAGYTPSAGAGTGYAQSDYGTSTFGSGAPAGGYYEPAGGSYAYSDPYSDPYAAFDYGGGYEDFGGDYGGGYDYGYEDFGGDYGYDYDYGYEE